MADRIEYPESAQQKPGPGIRMQDSLRTVGLVSFSGAVGTYDFIVFAFLAPVIGKIFFPPGISPWLVSVQTFGIFAAGYVFRPFGGIVLAHYSDLFGRKRIFAFSTLLMSGATLAIAVLPGYASIGIASPILLLAFRALQGIAIGSDIPGAWTLAAEQVPRERVGLACGAVSAGLIGGMLLAAVIVTALNLIFTVAEMEAFAWRIPFALGAALAVPAVCLRRRLKETRIYPALKSNRVLMPSFPLHAVLHDHRPALAFSILLTWVISAGMIVILLMTPVILQTVYGVTTQHALLAVSITAFGLTTGAFISGLLFDRLGPATCMMGGSILCALTSFSFYSLAGWSLPLLYILSASLGFTVGLLGAAPSIMVMSFPPRVRTSGVSAAYNITLAVFGGLPPALVAWLVQFEPMAPAYYILFIAFLTFCLGHYLYRNPYLLEGSAEGFHWGRSRT